MIQQNYRLDVQQILRIVLTLWIVYFCALAVLDWWGISDWKGFAREFETLFYYGVQAINGAFILGLVFLQRWRHWSEQIVLPIVIILMAGLPTLTVHIMMRLAPSEPLLSADGMMLRLTPILLTGLLLTAWQYRWLQVLLFCLGLAMLNLASLLLLPAPNLRPQTSFYGGVLITVIQMISLLMVGYITSLLVSRLKTQQQALEAANRQLLNRSTMQEELTISRERNRMARELHDTLAHTLSAVTVQLETAQAYWDVDLATSATILDTSLTATRSGLQETRQALKALRASPLNDMGLALALRQLATDIAERANLKLDLLIPTNLPDLPPAIEQCIYRVAQEATTNVGHHANANLLTVQLTFTPHILLQIRDDGQGFDPQQVTKTGHFGIVGMHERAALVNGTLHVQSQPGQGTTIQLVIEDFLP
ncbi:MAG: sensor histidine kinase [Chloroflexota bacterium]